MCLKKLLQPLLWVLLLVFSIPSFSQEVTIQGIVLDATSLQPMPFTQVAIYKANQTVPLSGTLSDTDGRFVVTVREPGSYRLSISFLGYQPHFQALNISSSVLDLGTIDLLPATQNLEEINVTAERKSVAKENGNWVLYPDKMPGDGTGNTVDLLNTLPSISVDIDDQISIRGRKASILIDGVRADDPNPLEHISPSSIAKIEVITNPSAKYDSEGSIINIQLKNPIQSKTYTKLQSWVDTKGNHQQNLYANKKQGKWGGFVQALNRKQWIDNQTQSIRNNHLQQQTPQINQDKIQEEEKKQQQIRLGLNHQPVKGKLLKMDVNFQSIEQDPEANIHKEKLTQTGELQQITKQNLLNKRDRKTNTVRLFYTDNRNDHKFKLMGSYRNQDRNNRSQNSYQNFTADNLPHTEYCNERKDRNQSQQDLYRFKADYEKQMGKQLKLEMGAEWQLDQTQQKVQQHKYNVADQNWLLIEGRTFTYHYQKDAAALYGIANLKHQKMYASFGCRFRYTGTSTENNKNGLANQESNHYYSLLPSVRLGQDWERIQMSLSYSKSQKLPAVHQLNSYRNDANPLNIQFGNPGLNPEKDHSLNLEISKQGEKHQLSLAIYQNWMRDMVFSQFSSAGDTLFRTYENLGDGSILGSEFSFSYKAKKWFRVNGSINTFYQNYQGVNLPLPQKNLWSFHYKISTLLRLDSKTQFQCNYNYQSKSLSTFGLKGKLYGLDVVASRKFFKKKLQISVKGINLLDSKRQFYQVENLQFTSDTQRYQDSRRVVLNVIYKWSKRKG
jgi:outer membrane receptor protein involved in Fe transport